LIYVGGTLVLLIFGVMLTAQARFISMKTSGAEWVLAAFVGGGVISLGSIVGFLAVLGIAARNSLSLIHHYLRLEGGEGMLSPQAVVLRGTSERLSPILASSAAIVAALLPIVVMGQIPGLEILQPTAIVIIGGLIASTLVTLFIMPALYLAIGAGTSRGSLADA